MRDAPEHPGQYLTRLMKEKEWSGTTLATVIDASQVHISHIRTGKSLVSIRMAVKLGAAFSVDPMEFVNRCTAWKLSQVSPRVSRKQYEMCPTCGRPNLRKPRTQKAGA